MNPLLYRVAVEAPLPEPLTYSSESEPLRRGQSVRVPLGKRSVFGVVLDAAAKLDEGLKIKEVQEVITERPDLSDPFLSWLEWLAKYYHYPVGAVIKNAFPPLKKHGRKNQSVLPPNEYLDPAPPLTAEQAEVLNNLNLHEGFKVHLLFGVTGSGKTEVYLRLLAEALEKDRTGLVLVPEIALTPQLIARFSARFPGQIAVIHSHLTEREKTNQWWEAHGQNKRILIGARSALFCPMDQLGVIVIDEEHEPSFKQDEKLRYHARDAAIMLAKMKGIPVVLGSATPSLETWANVQTGRYQLHRMVHRVQSRKLPEIHVIDLKDQREKKEASSLPFWLSEELFQAAKETLARGEQIAFFLNRRGLAQIVLCESCGYIHECPNCAISLTLHAKNHLLCHYCDYTIPLKLACPQCPDGEVKALGLGTEKLENDCQMLFPEARVARADRDEIQSREDLENLISQMEKGEIQILIGTQMIAKGLDFQGLTLVGVILADIGFNLPDFRASERSFQLLTQVAGRAGRHSRNPGQVFIQTYNPDHPSLVAAVHHDFTSFVTQELSEREQLVYPPFGRLALIKIQSLHLQAVKETARSLKARAEHLTQKRKAYENLRLLGPAPAPLAKLRNQFRYQFLIKGAANESQALHHFLTEVLGDKKWLPATTKVQIDVDPMNML